MKTLNKYLNEKLAVTGTFVDVSEKNPKLGGLMQRFIFAGKEPSSKLLTSLDNMIFGRKNTDEKMSLTIDDDSKTITFKNVDWVGATLKRWIEYHKQTSDYKTIFDEDVISIRIGSGKSMEQRRDWPYIDAAYGWEVNWYKVLNWIGAENPDIKIKLILKRFDCDGSLMRTDVFKKVYVESIEFRECRNEREMELPDDDYKRECKNSNMKLYSDSKRAKAYYTDNGF